MLINITASICFFIVLIILMIDFSSKERIDNLDNKSFKRLSITSAIGLFIEFIDYLLVINGFKIHSPLMLFLGKIIFLYYVIFMYLFIIYVYTTCKNIKTSSKSFEKFVKILSIIYIIIAIIVLILPFDFVDSIDYLYPVGVATIFSYFIGAMAIIFIIAMCIANFKNLKQKKSLPILWGMIGAIVSMILQINYHELLLLIPSHGLVIIIMYFTIENPDLKMIRELNIAKDAADKANMAKSDFLSSMSHEIRTPLNAIVGLSEDISTYKDKVPPEVVEDTNDIINASETLLEIVGNILDISKIESDKLELVPVPYHFKEEIESLVKITSTRIGDKPISYNLNLAPDIPYELMGDKGRVKEIINNLFTNAIKYTDKGKIDINVKCINKNDVCYLMISVSDTGKGIKADKINRLFDRFDRLDAERNTTVEGTGLGLAITKKLVEMMNGTINVQSQFGSGSMFMVNIPQKISRLTAPAADEVLDIDPNYDLGKRKILIVDDNNLNIKVATKALSSFDFELDSVTSGALCLEKVSTNTYDLILMDIMMPGMSGEETLSKLKENPEFKTPVIALTADAIAGAKEKYLEEGFTDYIAKPFNRDQIKEKLIKIFK